MFLLISVPLCITYMLAVCFPIVWLRTKFTLFIFILIWRGHWPHRQQWGLWMTKGNNRASRETHGAHYIIQWAIYHVPKIENCDRVRTVVRSQLTAAGASRHRFLLVSRTGRNLHIPIIGQTCMNIFLANSWRNAKLIWSRNLSEPFS